MACPSQEANQHAHVYRPKLSRRDTLNFDNAPGHRPDASAFFVFVFDFLGCTKSSAEGAPCAVATLDAAGLAPFRKLFLSRSTSWAFFDRLAASSSPSPNLCFFPERDTSKWVTYRLPYVTASWDNHSLSPAA